MSSISTREHTYIHHLVITIPSSSSQVSSRGGEQHHPCDRIQIQALPGCWSSHMMAREKNGQLVYNTVKIVWTVTIKNNQNVMKLVGLHCAVLLALAAQHC